jgi:hypothetical protein
MEEGRSLAMMRTELGVDVGSGATWSAEFGCNRDGECFLVVFVGDAQGADPPTRHFDRGDVCRVATVAREDHAS